MRVRNFIKKNYKIGIGVIIGLIISIVGVYAEDITSSLNVSYDNSKSNLTSTNMQGAIDELNEKADTIARTKPCKVIKGTGAEVGDEIACGTEEFYVLKSLGDSIRTITKYPIEQGKNISNPSYLQKEYCQMSKQLNATYCEGISSADGLSNYKSNLIEKIGLSDGISIEEVSFRYLNGSICSQEVEYSENGSIIDNNGDLASIPCPNASKIDTGLIWLSENISCNSTGCPNGLHLYFNGNSISYKYSESLPVKAVVTIPRTDII